MNSTSFKLQKRIFFFKFLWEAEILEFLVLVAELFEQLGFALYFICSIFYLEAPFASRVLICLDSFIWNNFFAKYFIWNIW